jgi:hypothetical protein
VGKPKAPAPPDYAAAAAAQGDANLNSALASNYLGQVNQVGPEGSLNYSYDSKGHTLPDGTFVPNTTATTVLSPEQQRLYDQNVQISASLNDVAQRGVNYVGDQASKPFDLSQLPNRGRVTEADQFESQRKATTEALLARMEPQFQRDDEALRNRLSNQGIFSGSEAYKTELDQQGRNVNDIRLQASLAGGQEANTLFNQGLAGASFNNQARAQSLQEQDYLRSQPLNLLNALRTGNQVSMPQFANLSTGANVAAAPVYQAVNDEYQAKMDAYKSKQSTFGALLGGLGTLGGAALKGSDRRLKTNIKRLGTSISGLGIYTFNYLNGLASLGFMADEVLEKFPEKVSWKDGYLQVEYRGLF